MSANDMTRESIRIVAADQAISQKNVTDDFLLPNAIFFTFSWSHCVEVLRFRAAFRLVAAHGCTIRILSMMKDYFTFRVS